jgi:pilus assembly protein CpaC
MNRRLIATLLSAACAVAPLAILPAGHAMAQSVSRPVNDIVLSIGRGQLVTLPGKMSDVFVANETVADVQVRNANQLYVMGKGGGETTIYASNAAGQTVWSANVRVGSNLDSIDQMLRLAMPEARVNVATMNGTVLLTGTVAAPEDAAEAERLVKAFVGGDESKVNVVSRLKMATPLQVNLQVRFAEVSRSLVRDINSNLVTRDQTGGFIFGTSRGQTGVIKGGDMTGTQVEIDPCAFYRLACTSRPIPFDPIKGVFVTQNTTYDFPRSPTGKSVFGAAGKLLGLDLLGTLEMGERVGLVTTLSNPNLTALSGETADFLAGGEFPIPTSQGLGTVSIEYRKFGVSLAYTPTVLANGRISIRVRPEVSELSTQGAVNINGFQIPALTIRRAETTVELGSGQSFMIAGLMSNTAQRTLEKAPGVGDIPILGNLFKSTSFQKGETELVIVVTPYLVNPVDANDIKLPTDGFQTPTEVQRLLGNMENDGKSGASRPVPTAAGESSVPAGPQVGALAQPAAPQLAQGKPAKKKPAGKGKQAALAQPGFSLK